MNPRMASHLAHGTHMGIHGAMGTHGAMGAQGALGDPFLAPVGPSGFPCPGHGVLYKSLVPTRGNSPAGKNGKNARNITRNNGSLPISRV